MNEKVYELSDIDFDNTIMIAQQKPPDITTKLYKYNLLHNVHNNNNNNAAQPPPQIIVKPPKANLRSSNSKIAVATADYIYFHYNCDGKNDSGWGCAYRTLQSICSYILLKKDPSVLLPAIPSIDEIQSILVQLQDKPKSFLGSREWIGAIEVSYVLDFLYNVPSRILHSRPTSRDSIGLREHVQTIYKHFEGTAGGSICMMGGDADAASKGIVGIRIDENNHDADDDVYLLIIDPHFSGIPKSKDDLIDGGYVRWQHLKEFNKSSFYNICIPQIT